MQTSCPTANADLSQLYIPTQAQTSASSVFQLKHRPQLAHVPTQTRTSTNSTSQLKCEPVSSEFQQQNRAHKGHVSIIITSHYWVNLHPHNEAKNLHYGEILRDNFSTKNPINSYEIYDQERGRKTSIQRGSNSNWGDSNYQEKSSVFEVLEALIVLLFS